MSIEDMPGRADHGRVFPGGHFYLEPGERDLLTDITKVVGGTVA